MTLPEAVAIAPKIRLCPEWRYFKFIWDGKTPRKNSKQFKSYQNDAASAQKAIEKIISESQAR